MCQCGNVKLGVAVFFLCPKEEAKGREMDKRSREGDAIRLYTLETDGKMSLPSSCLVLFSRSSVISFYFLFHSFPAFTLKDVICVKYCYLHFLLHSPFTLQVLHFSFSCSLFLSRPYLQSLTPWIPQSLETLPVQPNIAHTHRALFEIQAETSKFPKTPHLSGWVLRACPG